MQAEMQLQGAARRKVYRGPAPITSLDVVGMPGDIDRASFADI